MDIDGIMAKIKKMHDHAVSAKKIGSIEEAKTFAAKVNELLLRHKLSMTDVEYSAREKVDPLGGTHVHGTHPRWRRVAWQEELAKIVARAHFCRILVRQGSSVITFVGRTTDRDVAIYLFQYLARVTETHVNKEYNRLMHAARYRGAKESMHGWKQSFYEGFLYAISERFYETRKKVMGGATKTQHALVKREDATLQKYYKGISGGSASSIGGTTAQWNEFGHSSGDSFGRSVPIHQGVTGTGKDRQQLRE